MISRKKLAVAATACLFAFGATGANAALIELGTAGLTAHGDAFCGAGNAVTETFTAGGYDVVLSGGIGLAPNVFFPAAASYSAIYGSSNLGNACNNQSGYLNPLTVQFFAAGTGILTNVTNFVIDVFNGNNVAVDYTVADDAGHSSTVNIAAVGSSGKQQFGFASGGNTFTIFAAFAAGQAITWDTFINNIGFQDLVNAPGGPVGGGGGDGPVGTVPEPGTVWLAGLAMLAVYAGRRRKLA